MRTEPGTPAVGERFELVAEHKRGGMGTVWRARDRLTERPVAVKLLHTAAPEHSARFREEAMLLAGLTHERIVGHVAHGTTDEGVPFLAMEWLDGESLAERLARAPLTLHESITVARGAARGLAVAHERGIVHRDLKPSNLFLREGRIDDVVLLDLGIARLLADDRSLTRTGAILGTPSYMAPEQASGRGLITPAVDVFSLGCVLFECLTGGPPFVGDHVFAVLARLLFEDAPRLGERRPDLPVALEAFVDRLLAKDPTRRPPDAAAVLAGLDALGATPDAGTPLPRQAAPSEQELVSVILTSGPRGSVDATLPAGPPEPTPDVSAFGAELRQLATGTLVVTLAQREGAATDLALRAARCALRLRELRPAWSIVLATGLGIARRGVHIGEAVDRAAGMLRAAEEAPRGEIHLDDVTAGLLDARFHTSRRGTIVALDGEEPTIDPTRPLLGRPTACVGRDLELATLELALRACVEAANPRAVLVVGQPGMGKSRLRHELVRRLEARGDEILVLLGAGDPIRASGNRGLLAGALARLFGIDLDAPRADDLAAIETRVGRHVVEDRARTAAFLGELCGVHAPAGTLPELDAARQDPRIMADLTAQAWLGFARAEAAARPLLIVLDDLQWSDALSIALVDAALRQLGSSPILVLALARPEAQETFPDLWSPFLQVLPLRPLGAAATARFVKQALGEKVGDDSVQRIVARAAGNALYLEELIRAADARGEVVPDTVMAMLRARIGLLSPPARRVLRAASVFGETFPLAGVEALLGGDAELGPSLAVLARHEILEQQQNRWRFRHVLMRDAAYGLLTDEDLLESHALAARFLEGAGEDPAVIAAHCELGGDGAGAVRHYIAAADLARRRIDHGAALRLVARGLAAGAAGVERGALRSIEAQTQLWQGQFAASMTASLEACDLLPARHENRILSLSVRIASAMQLGTAPQLDGYVEELLDAEPSREERAEYMAALGWSGISFSVTGRRPESERFLARMAAVDAAADDDETLVRGLARYYPLRFEEMLGDDPYATWCLARAGLPYHRTSGDRRYLGLTLAEVGECARWLGSFDDAFATMREAIKVGDGLGEPITRDLIRQYLATGLAVHGADADLPEAREIAAAVVAGSAGRNVYRGLGLISRALVRLRDGDLAGAEADAREGRVTMRSIGVCSFFPHGDLPLLEVLARRKDPEAGVVADEALHTVDTMGPMGLMELPLRLSAARAYLALGRRDAAARDVARAIACLDRRAAAIPDPAVREKFIHAVPEHVALRELAGELG